MELLRRPSTFRRLWSAQFVSAIGDGMRGVALLWWAAQTGGADALVAVGLAGAVPVVVCSPIGGRLADSLDRRRLLVASNLARLATSSLLAVALLNGDAALWPVVALAATAATAGAVFDPTYAAVVPTVVADDDLEAANGLDMANGAVGGLLGPLAGGALIAVLDVGAVLVVDAATFAVSAAVLARCRIPRPAFATADDGVLGPTRSGVVARLRSIPGLVPMVALAMTLNMVVAPLPLLLAAFATDRLDASPALFGAMPTLISVGLLIGSVTASKLSRGPIAVPFLGLGAFVAAVGVLPSLTPLAALLGAGVAIAVANARTTSLFQRSIPADIQGQSFGILGSLGEGLRPVGLALGGPLLALAGAGWSFVVVGGAVAAATLAFAPFVPSAPKRPGSSGSSAPRPAPADGVSERSTFWPAGGPKRQKLGAGDPQAPRIGNPAAR